MTYCLRCNTPYSNLNLPGSEPSVFCGECRSLLRNRLKRGDTAETPQDFDLLYTPLWQEEVDPLIARLDTDKLPSTPVEKPAIGSNAGTVTNIFSPIAQNRSIHTSRRIALVVLAMLVVLALAVNGASTFKSILQTQQHNAQKPTLSHVLTATAHAVQLPSPTAQSTPSSSPAPGVVQPTATVSSASKAPTHASSAATTPRSQPPVESVSSSALTFSATQGQANSSGQVVNIANTGGSSLNWTASIDSSAASWLSTARSKGTVAARQTGQVMVKVNITGLTPGLYSANLTISASDRSGIQVQGSPHVILVTLTVAQPCTLQITPSNLSFTVWVLQPNSSGKTITLTETGNCAFPLSWTASAGQGWISLSASSGTDNGSGSAITVQIKANGMSVGNYSGQITLSAVGRRGDSVQGSPQTISVTLTVSLV